MYYRGGNKEPLRKGRLSMVDLHEPTSLGQLIFIMKILFIFVTKQAALMRRSVVLSRPLQLVFSGRGKVLQSVRLISIGQKCLLGLFYHIIGAIKKSYQYEFRDRIHNTSFS